MKESDETLNLVSRLDEKLDRLQARGFRVLPACLLHLVLLCMIKKRRLLQISIPFTICLLHHLATEMGSSLPDFVNTFPCSGVNTATTCQDVCYLCRLKDDNTATAVFLWCPFALIA